MRMLAAIEAKDGEGARAALVEDISSSAAVIETMGNLPD